MSQQKGFTLVEILFVLVIAAGIMLWAVPSYKRAQERSRYEAATGVLLDVGSAVVSFKQYLTAQGISTPFPGNSPYEVNNTTIAQTNSNALQGKTLGEALAGVSSDKVAWLLGLIKPLGYLDALPTSSDYTYYMVTNTGANICNSQCSSYTDIIACMCKAGESTENMTKDCYYGAIYLKDGTVHRLRGSQCSL